MDNSKKAAFGYGFTTADGTSHVNEQGLTKREYFSLHLISAIISNADIQQKQGVNVTLSYEHLTEIAIKCADALLKELDKTDEQL
jgi:hypothetical protein